MEIGARVPPLESTPGPIPAFLQVTIGQRPVNLGGALSWMNGGGTEHPRSEGWSLSLPILRYPSHKSWDGVVVQN